MNKKFKLGQAILNMEKRPLAAIVVTGFSRNIDIRKDSERVMAVKETALMISKQLYCASDK